MGGQGWKGDGGHVVIAGHLGVESERRFPATLRGVTLASQEGCTVAVISQKDHWILGEKRKDILFMPNGKEFEMKIFPIHNASGAHSSPKVPGCQMQ